MTSPERRKESRLESIAVEEIKDDVLPVWLFIDENETDILSIITDMSTSGLAMVVPKDAALPDKSLSLRIFCSETGDLPEVEIKAELRWVDENYAIDHKKVGLKFEDQSDEILPLIAQVLEWLRDEQDHYLRCVVKKVEANP